MMSDGRTSSKEEGFILFIAVALLALLTIVAVGASISVQNDFRISGNATSGASAFYLADSGIEWAKNQLAQAETNPPVVEGRSESFRSGNFTVSFGAPRRVAPLSATVVVRSVGNSGSASQTLQAQLTKAYDLSDAAVALRGNSRGVNFTGDSFAISGRDFDPATRQWISQGKSRPGISVSSDALMAQLESGLTDVQQQNISGESPEAPPLAGSDKLDSDAAGRLADDMCASANAQTTVVPVSGTLSLANRTWGTRTAPQIRCIEGWAGAGDFVYAGDNFTGAGVLVIKNTEVVALGTLYWEGLILITGNHIGLRVEGSENKEIFGSLILNETGPLSEPGPALFDLRGSLRVSFSRAALGNSVSPLSPSSLARSYLSLPGRVIQEYWRSDGP